MVRHAQDGGGGGNGADSRPTFVEQLLRLGLNHIVQYTTMVLAIGGSWWYMQAAVDVLKTDVEVLKQERMVTATKLASMETKLDFMILELTYLRQEQSRRRDGTDREGRQ